MASEVELEHRIQSLPQELQDEIFDYYLIIPANTVAIKKSYKPPGQLQINRATREKAAKDYYAGTTFNLGRKSSRYGAVCIKWLYNLPLKHVGMISRVHLELSSSKDSMGRKWGLLYTLESQNGWGIREEILNLF